ncbi:hypothetical protein TrCOL_g6382 [Triparma columacea]|uniref:Uncharacterized protein n=1 Tax=Triparma columacea TaxID=722753 RepID=A0A9W7LBG9_9STRA|nr:hypothetical protein TrCOL_g6382 [Triparma columacea]
MMNFSPPPPAPFSTTSPRFLPQSEGIVEAVKDLSNAELKKALGDAGEKIVKEAKEDYENWGNNDPIPSIFAYEGFLDGRNLSQTSLTTANECLRFLDPIYGILSPGDGIQKYRMELSASLPVGKLSNYWKAIVSPSLLEEFSGVEKGVLLNAASKEYSSLLSFPAFIDAGVDVVDVDLVKKGGGNVPTVHAKYARGALARWVCENGISDVEGIKGWEGEGFKFVREGEAKKGKTGNVVLVFEKGEEGKGKRKRE